MYTWILSNIIQNEICNNQQIQHSVEPSETATNIMIPPYSFNDKTKSAYMSPCNYEFFFLYEIILIFFLFSSNS